MISWGEFKLQKPEWAEAGERIFKPASDAIGFLATVAKDGRPRMAPICPIFALHRIYLSAARHTVKYFDLVNDGRYVLHAFLGEGDEEFQFSGLARMVTSDDEKRDVHANISFQFDPADAICELPMNRALWAYWIDPGQPGTKVVKQVWQLDT